jgi:hypothetical protein
MRDVRLFTLWQPTILIEDVSKRYMKTRIIICLAIIWLAVSCREEADPKRACSVENPVQEWENSAWGEFAYVAQATYRNQTVFIYGNCCATCNTIIPVYNCSGEQIGIVHGTIDASIMDDDVLIWKSTRSTCAL